MEVNLPASTQLHQSVPSLPRDVQRITNRLYPSNGSVFSPGQQLQFDLGSSGSLVPESMTLYFTYSIAVTGDATSTANTFIAGTPCYSPFNRLDTVCNGATLSSIANYNQVGHLLAKTRMGLSERASAASSMGISTNLAGAGGDKPQSLENLNAYAIQQDDAVPTCLIPCAQPVISVLTTADKLIPLFAAGAMRMTFWLDQQSNYVVAATAGAQTVAVTLINVSLVYDTVRLGQQYEDMVRAQGSIFCRSTHYGVISQNIASASSASNIDTVFQARFSSIRALYTTATYAGRSYNDSFSVTGTTGAGSGGRCWFNIDGVQYPSSGIDLGNLASVYDNLRVAAHSTGHSADSFAMAIPWTEWYAMSTVTPLAGNTVSPMRPGSFYLAQSLEKMGSAGGFLVNGTSSQSSPIIMRLTTNGATLAYSLALICACDCILTFDTMARTIQSDV